ncbi:hypothetical protein HDV05_004415 [Chytridiales sp. JEL 0842]|nr:hypothetical protein HDV05_004415 [Chytridiales sp. JEL 0842]
MPLLVAFINLKENFEDSVIVSDDVNTRELFARPHVIIASSSITNRGTIGQLYEAWASMNAIKHRGDAYNFDPLTIGSQHKVVIDATEQKAPPEFCCYVRMPGRAGLSMRRNASGDLERVKADYGVCQIWQLGHLSSDKQHYLSHVPKTASVGRGRLHGFPVKLGEMEILNLLSRGMTYVMINLDINRAIYTYHKHMIAVENDTPASERQVDEICSSFKYF